MKKRLIKNLLLVLTMVVLCFAVGVMASAEEFTENGFIYEVKDGNAVIVGCDSNVSGNVTIPSTIGGYAVTEIGDRAFEGNLEITNVEIPESVIKIGRLAFRNCSNLTNINISENVVVIDDYTFADCGKLANIKIPEGVTVINTHAFANCDSLTNIVIPDSVTTIGTCAFFHSENIETINLGSGVAIIEYFAFDVCANLSRINVDEDNKNFSSDEYGVLFNKDKTVLVKFPMGSEIKKYTIPEGVTTVNEYAFLFCSGLTDIAFPESLSTIESYGFYACYSLNKCVFNNGIKTVGEYAFAECYSLIDIIISDGSESLGEACFAYAPFLEKVIVKSMDVALELGALCVNNFQVVDISREEFASLYAKSSLGDKEAEEKLNKHMIYADGLIFIGTIYCHPGSTAEAYAKEHTEMFGEVKYVLTHFYEGEWTYDYDNMIRYRKCIHCDELETEALETTEDGDVDIIAPVDPDTDFTVDVITDYVIIEETLSENISGDFEIVKAFDINLKNKDGVHVQPDGTVKVKLPVDWTKEGVYKVYRVNDDGTLTDMKAYREGSHMVFDTDHFSVYVIVDESEKADIPTAPDEPQEETKPTFWEKLVDLIKSFFELIASIFNK